MLPPVCSATSAQVTTQADVPVELPAAVCSDPAGLPLRVKPKLDRKRTALARFSCDQRCSFSVRLEAKLKGKKRSLAGKRLKRTLEPGRVLALRLKLPSKPKGALRSVWIAGSVQGEGGTRTVKLPVTPRR